MKVLVSGASGLIGSAVVRELEDQGYEVLRLVRTKNMGDDTVYWNFEKEEIDLIKLEGIDAVVHLAGENIATGRWTKEKKKKIWDSRVEGTRFLCHSFGQLKNPPKVLLCASAVGFYGDQGNTLLREDDPQGKGFLAKLCREWEQATEEAQQAGIRVVNMRFGIVLSADGGALKQMLTPFKLGLGGMLGSGKQFVSWITIDDLVKVISMLIKEDSIHGVINIVSPYPVTNEQLTKTLGEILRRPTFCRCPGWLLKLLLGEVSDVLLASIRVKPERLLKKGFAYQYPELIDALKHLYPS